MEARATLRNIRMTPRKVRVVLNEIRNQPVDVALAQLKFTPRRAARVLYKLLESAVANASVKFGKAEPGEMYVKEAFADSGPTLRRFMPRSQGRATRINKRTSQVTLVVAEQD